ncbi:MAG: glycosyltransferase, partial [Desulfobacteraceae bacterium]|nr:glycosyltransferase [Desulfobacteraceae bacterium]
MSLFVSVIIPVYNDPVGIDKCLKALVEQTWPRDAYEIIVADNRSTDETQCIIQNYAEKYPELVRLVVENDIQSSYAARNKGLQAARGEILAFTDSDCVPEQDWIEAGIKALQHQKAACGGGRITFFFKDKRPNIYEYLDSARTLNQQAYVEQVGFAATANFFARRELFERYGKFRYNLVSGGDYEFGRRLTTAGEKMIFISGAIVQHPA